MNPTTLTEPVACYKLTDKNGRTYNQTQWGRGVQHKASGEGELCGPGWLHAYHSPLLAMLMNTAHAAFDDARLWLAEGSGLMRSDGLKLGFTELRTLEELALPEVTTEQRVVFSIRCALSVHSEPSFVAWANAWLIGKDRSEKSAWAAAPAGAWEVEAARSAAVAATRAAWAAEESAEAASWAWAAAALAAEAAALDTNCKLDFVAIANEACE